MGGLGDSRRLSAAAQMTWIWYLASRAVDYCTIVEMASNVGDVYALVDRYC